MAANFGVGSWIERRARISPSATAVVAGDRVLTYAEMARRVRQTANAFRSLGVRRGDRVAWIGPNHLAFLETFFGAGLLGAALAPVNHRFARDHVRAVLEDTEPVLLVQHLDVPRDGLPASVRSRLAVGGAVPGAMDFEELVSNAPDDLLGEAVDGDDLCLLPHTSGTTGRPKGVMLTHANVTWNAVNVLSRVDFRSTDVTIAIAPFFRVGGTGVNVLPVLFVGGSVVIPTDATPAGVVASMERHRVTVGFANPDLLQGLAASSGWRNADLGAVRFIVTGGAPVPRRLIEIYADRGIALIQGYGLSEAAPVVMVLEADAPADKVGSAGKPVLLVDTRVVRPDGSDVSAGETGELLVRGPNVMAGYWRRPDETREVQSPEGWLRTGDAARVDTDGYFWIVDRVADGISTASGIVYPGDVERALARHSDVADVGVIGLPGVPELAIVALVVAAAGTSPRPAEILEFARRTLPPEQVPADVVLVESLPRNSVGKLLRRELATGARRGRTRRASLGRR